MLRKVEDLGKPKLLRTDLRCLLVHGACVSCALALGLGVTLQ